jgi:hypothetical protein
MEAKQVSDEYNEGRYSRNSDAELQASPSVVVPHSTCGKYNAFPDVIICVERAGSAAMVGHALCIRFGLYHYFTCRSHTSYNQSGLRKFALFLMPCNENT